MGVLLRDGMAAGGEGWLVDPDGYWVKRFHRDTKASAAYPRVFIDIYRYQYSCCLFLTWLPLPGVCSSDSMMIQSEQG